jgi:hypothetical protein
MEEEGMVELRGRNFPQFINGIAWKPPAPSSM